MLSGVSIDEFFEFFELDKDEEIESTTVNGWLTEKCGSIPEEDYCLEYENLVIRVTKADDLMTHEIAVTRTFPEPVSDEEEDKDED